MLRNLFLASLTVLSITALAQGDAQAGGRGGTATPRGKSETPSYPAQANPTPEKQVAAKPVVKKKVVRASRRASARSSVRRAHGAVMNYSLIRQSWTIADLNPMPALLDLDDTLKRLQQATEDIAQAMRR